MRFIVGMALCLMFARDVAAAPILRAPAELILGDAPGLAITGLAPGSKVRLHALRRTVVSNGGSARPADRPVVVHAWADFKADRQGRMAADRAVPLAGTYNAADP